MKQSSKAFTLVELVVVIAIISVLTGIGAVSYSGIQARARDADRKNDMAQIKIALADYYSSQIASPVYPIATTTITINNSNDALTAALKPNYLREMPLDPTNSGNYIYKYQSSANAQSVANRNYTLFATLENTKDKAGWNNGTTWVADGYRVQPDF
jgi:prepilin-type N-terminal cleavage/methylation domain-containing protein